MSGSATTAAPRRRDPEAHRRAILEAARAALAEHGYVGATIRDIARRAGVTHGLVMRHFGSKEELMRAALPDPPALIEIAAPDSDPATLPERVARTFIARMDDDARASPLVGILRTAAGNERVAGELYAEMRRRTIAAAREVLGASDLDVRADLVAAVLIGVTFERYVVAEGTLAQMAPAALEAHLAGIIRHVLEPVLPRA